jgi:hypothetical protein
MFLCHGGLEPSGFKVIWWAMGKYKKRINNNKENNNLTKAQCIFLGCNITFSEEKHKAGDKCLVPNEGK